MAHLVIKNKFRDPLGRVFGTDCPTVAYETAVYYE